MSKKLICHHRFLLKTIISFCFTFFALEAFSQFGDRDLRGVYDVELTINGKVFQDVMVIENEKVMRLNSFQGPLKGSMEVPTIFKAPIDGIGVCSIWGNMSCSFSFFIMAKERGQEFRVNYEMIMEGEVFINALTQNGPIIFTGQASLSDGEILGTLIARQRPKHE